MSQRLAFSQPPRKLSHSVCTNLGVAHIKLCQRLPAPKRPELPRSFRTYLIATQGKMSQRLALPKRPCKHSRPLIANPVVSQIKMSQRLALAQCFRKAPGSLVTKLIVPQI
eukprot:1969184-Rhodomonas_salina.1